MSKNEVALSAKNQNPVFWESTDALACAALVNVNLTLPPDVLIRQAGEAINIAGQLGFAAGLAFLAAKEKCEHGEFVKYLNAQGVVPNIAQEHMAIAAMLVKATPDDRVKLMRQTKTAMIGLARMDEEIRQHWLDTGELDEQLTLKDYKKLVDKREADNKALQQINDTQATTIKRLEAATDSKVDSITPMQVAVLRKASTGFANDAVSRLQAFEDLRTRVEALSGIAKPWARALALQMMAAQHMVLLAAQDQLAKTVEAFALEGQAPSAYELEQAIPLTQETQQIREHLQLLSDAFAIEREDVLRQFANAAKDDQGDKGRRFDTVEKKAKTGKKA